MFAFHTSRGNARSVSATLDMPIGDPYGGPANGKREDVGSVIGAVAGPIIGGIFGNESANTQAAAATQAAGISGDAVKYAADVQKQIYDQARADQQPWRNAGIGGLNALAAGIGSTGMNGPLTRNFAMTDYQEDPGYQFRLSEGLKALDRSAAARGGLLSGAALKGINRYGQDYASNEYQNAYNRFQSNQTNQFNRLASIAGLGQTANNALQNAGSAYGSNVGNLAMTGAANAGNALLSAGNARASAYQGIGSSLGRVDWGKVFGGGSSNGGGDIFQSYPTFPGGYDW